MGPDLERKGRLGSIASMDVKENEQSPVEPVEKTMSCISNYQDDILELEASDLKQADQVKLVEKSKVRISGSTHQSENPLNESVSQDETENSSSFGNTLSGDENDDILSDSEVMSKLHDNEVDQECRMRKKRLTSHWKTFIQPYMWRCRWAELKIRQLLYQASKYDLQAEAISRRQQLASKDTTVEDTGAKSLPFSGSMQKEALIQRKKRKRVEDSTDTASYTAQHPLFSYRGRKKCGADMVSSLNDRANIGIPMNNRVESNSVFGCSNKPVSLEFRNDDNSLEQILCKIGVLQSHLGELKTRFKKVSTVASQLMPKCNRCDMLTTGSAISTHGEDTNLIDIIKCNDKLQSGISCEKEGDGHLMHNRTATELNNTEKVEIQPTERVEVQPTEKFEVQSTEKFEIQPTEKVESQPTEKPETPKEEEQVPSVPVISISDDQPETRKEEHANRSSSVQVISTADDEPTPKTRSISGLTSPHNTRSRGWGQGCGRGRGRRRGSRWSRRA